MEIQIRKLLPNESDSYRKLRIQCLKNHPEFFTTNYQDEKVKQKLFFQICIEQSLTNSFVMGAFHNNILIGISGFKRHHQKKTNHSGIIIQVYVISEFQGQKIGSNLTKQTLDEAFKIDGIEHIEIGVISSNKKAENIYKTLGFQHYGLHKNFLKINSSYYDHVLMMIFKHQYLAI